MTQPLQVAAQPCSCCFGFHVEISFYHKKSKDLKSDVNLRYPVGKQGKPSNPRFGEEENKFKMNKYFYYSIVSLYRNSEKELALIPQVRLQSCV